jgi:hypothetical protein
MPRIEKRLESMATKEDLDRTEERMLAKMDDVIKAVIGSSSGEIIGG